MPFRMRITNRNNVEVEDVATHFSDKKRQECQRNEKDAMNRSRGMKRLVYRCGLI